MELIERRRTIMSAPHIEEAEDNVVTTKHALAKPLKKCEADIELVQDLHGQDSPYPPGGGKNLFNKNTLTDNLLIDADGNETESSSYITSDYIYTTNINTTISSIGAVDRPYKYRVAIYDSNKTWLRRALGTSDTLTINAVNNCYIRISFEKSRETDFDTVQVELGNQKTDYAPYENICQIVGWTGMELSHTGKNLMHGLEIGKGYNTNTGVPSVQSEAARTAKVRADFSKYEYYTVTLNSDCPNTMIFAWDEDGNFVGRSAGSANRPYRVTKMSFTLGSNGNRNFDHIKYIAIRWYNAGTRVVANLASANIQLEAGYDSTAFEPSVRNDILVSFPAQGKNLFDKDNATKYERAFSGGRWIPYTGAASYLYKCEPDTDYVVTALNNNLTFFRIACIHENLPIPDTGDIALYNRNITTAQGSLDIHTDSSATYIVVQVKGSQADATLIQIEKGTIATSYEPYNNIIYGGTLDLLAGTLAINYGYRTLTASDIQEFGVNSYGLPYMYFLSPGNIEGTNTVTLLCDKYKQSMSAQKDFSIRRTGGICIYDSRITNQQEAEALFGTVTYIFSREIPIVYQLTPQQITALKGINNIWADTGKTRIAYWTH